MLQEDVVSETAQMSWGDFKPRLADAVSLCTNGSLRIVLLLTCQ